MSVLSATVVEASEAFNPVSVQTFKPRGSYSFPTSAQYLRPMCPSAEIFGHSSSPSPPITSSSLSTSKRYHTAPSSGIHYTMKQMPPSALYLFVHCQRLNYSVPVLAHCMIRGSGDLISLNLLSLSPDERLDFNSFSLAADYIYKVKDLLNRPSAHLPCRSPNP